MRFNGESGETHIDEIKRDNTHVEILWLMRIRKSQSIPQNWSMTVGEAHQIPCPFEGKKSCSEWSIQQHLFHLFPQRRASQYIDKSRNAKWTSKKHGSTTQTIFIVCFIVHDYPCDNRLLGVRRMRSS
jgi:hypothetical protein